MVEISPNGKNKVTFITQPKKVLLVNVTLFLLFDHFLTTFWPFFDTFKEQESFFQQNETFYMNHNNKPDILVHVWILCHIWVNFSFYGNFPISKGFWAI